jgi:hypothetical protein
MTVFFWGGIIMKRRTTELFFLIILFLFTHYYCDALGSDDSAAGYKGTGTGTEFSEPDDYYDYLEEGTLIPPELIRPEESIHLFQQNLPSPGDGFILGSSWRAIQWDTARGQILAAQLCLKGGKIPENERQPLNAVIVLDHSGSMDYERKMEFAKEAAKNFIAHIGSTDIISLIIFDSETETIFRNITGSEAKDRTPEIDSIGPGGSTNIEMGLNDAFSILEEDTSVNSIKFILLTTDGLPTAGNTDSDHLINLADQNCGTEIIITSVGVGSDVDADLLTQIAESCQGKYYFVDSIETIQDVFIQEANEIIQSSAIDVEVTINLPVDFPSYGFIGYQTLTGTDGFNQTNIGNIPSEGERIIILEWDLDEENSDSSFYLAPGTSGTVTADINYQPGDSEEITNIMGDLLFPIDSYETGENAALVARNTALGHMLMAFIQIGTKVMNDSQSPDADDLALVNDVMAEMKSAENLVPNDTDTLFSEFIEVGEKYRTVLQDMITDQSQE